MSTVQRSNKQTQPDKMYGINFQVPEGLKIAIDLELARQQTSLREFGTKALAAAVEREGSRRKKEGR